MHFPVVLSIFFLLFPRLHLPPLCQQVWSFGVTLWEITSLGKSPYEKLNPNNMYAFLQSGKRMGKPLWCNDEMYELMLKCWNWNAKDRPTFNEIIQCLESMYTREVQPVSDLLSIERF